MTISSTNLVDDNFKVINKITGARNEDEKLIELDNLKGSTNESEISIANVYYEVEGTGTVKLQFDNEKELKSITIKFEDGKKEKILTDVILGFFGLIMKLGPIAEWGLNMDKKTIKVNPENFETNKKGIFAVGDICSYPGKLKLILSGFHEAALAAQEAFRRARPDEVLTFRYTTSSTDIQKKLGVK